MGFLAVAAGPFVRSSHNAEEVFALARGKMGKQESQEVRRRKGEEVRR
jgi:hypothetical protein